MSHSLRGRNRARGMCRLALVSLVFSLLAFGVPSGPSRVASAAPPAGGEVSTEPITASELLSGAAPESLSANARFAPPEGAREAVQPFTGTLRLDGAPMTMLASDANGQPRPDGFTSSPILGKDTTFFPDVSLSFFTHRGHLVPTTQDVVRNGSLLSTRSFWDIIVQPGRVWSEPGDPPGWNRAAFPFALTQGADLGLESTSHNGLALFLYRGSQVSSVRFQLVQQTAPWYIDDYFTSWGVTDASYRPGGIDNLGQRVLGYEKELADRLPVKPWSALDEEVSSDALVQASTTHPDANPDVLVSAVVRNGVLYRSDCPTAAGPYPYCDEMRNHIWSATKSAFLNAAMLRVAEKYGVGILDEPIAKYLPEARRPGWDDVTFRDMANMSSGHTVPEDDGYDPRVQCYAEQRTEQGRTDVAMSFPRTYQPGAEFHYNSHDSYLEGAALDALIKTKEGPEASAYEMLRREVYRPIGIHHAPSVFSIEEDGSQGQPKWEEGYYATLDDLAKIALLYQNHGAWGGRQILHRELVDELLPTTTQPPQDRSPNPGYYLNWWNLIARSGIESEWVWVPQMRGWGGNWVAVLPRDLVTIQIANFPASDWPPEDYVDEWPIPDPCNADGASG